MIRNLSESYAGREGAPLVHQVDMDIFTKTYFMHCMACTFCNDSCCQYGADVSLNEARRIEEKGDAIERYTRVPRAQWFDETFQADLDFAGEGNTQTSLGPRGCIFLNPTGRSCMIHAFCLENGMDYHALKPMVCCLFPVTFGNGLLSPSLDVDDASLICLDQGPSLYAGAREELRYYFGDELVAELDAIEAAGLAPSIVNVSVSQSLPKFEEVQ
ncbi:MAG: YkgJ family cysteine cluster protein [Chloroflexi bacterium]|nr:YkgJ family cysteine cluster protein [Chloroflexota bacterium]